jgi:hypothetical protein
MAITGVVTNVVTKNGLQCDEARQDAGDWEAKYGQLESDYNNATAALRSCESQCPTFVTITPS